MSAAKRIGVLIAEDDDSVRQALEALITGEPELMLLAAVADADEAITAARASQPDVALVDVHMPGGGGARATREIARCSPGTRVLALSASDDRGTVLEMLEAGAVGYLVKGASIASIIESVTQAANGKSCLSAEVAGEVIGELVQELSMRRHKDELNELHLVRIKNAIHDERALSMVAQPICALEDGSIIGVEALARFRGPPRRSPDRWFAESSDVGLRTELEVTAASKALCVLDALSFELFVAINVSPETVAAASFQELVSEPPGERVVLEITEHAPIDDYERLNAALAALRANGIRLAIDDAGAGFASLRHILNLKPDFIKLDATLIAGIEVDRSKQALATGLISFAQSIGATIVAEGIERIEELEVLRSLGVVYGQGYYLGQPATLDGGSTQPLSAARPSSLPG